MNKFFSELGEWVECFLGGFALVMLACALLLLDTGCSASESESGDVVLLANTFTTEDPVVREELERNLARISEATGIVGLSVGDDGIPVARVADFDADHNCDVTRVSHVGSDWRTNRISLGPVRGPGCWDEETSLLHELIHALAPSAEHAQSGLFAGAIQDDKLDAEAVTILCAHVECSVFNPEIREPSSEPTENPPEVCFWGHPQACAPCSGNRDYGPGNTCTDIVWQGRSETDFCLKAFPCDSPPQPVTQIDSEQ